MTTFTVLSDPGVDDLIALRLLDRLSPHQSHSITSTFGNVEEKYTAQNAKEFIAFSAKHWTFSHGATSPLKPRERSWADDYHGPDGVFGVHPPINTGNISSEDYPQKDAVISLGPLTELVNLKKIINLKEVMVMGGSFNRKGNDTSFSEYNIRCDPDAAEEFFKNCVNTHVKVVPLDVTYQTSWTKEQILQAPQDTEKKKWLKRLLLAWFEGYGTAKKANFVLFDPLAVFLQFYPEYATWKTSGVSVVIEGKQRGRTMLNENNPPCEIALELNEADKIQKTIFDLVFS